MLCYSMNWSGFYRRLLDFIGGRVDLTEVAISLFSEFSEHVDESHTIGGISWRYVDSSSENFPAVWKV